MPHWRLKPITRRPIPQVWLGLHSRGGSSGPFPQAPAGLLFGVWVTKDYGHGDGHCIARRPPLEPSVRSHNVMSLVRLCAQCGA